MTTLAPGTVFAGDYRVVRPLSAGGMGMVYVAHQISTGRDRALKIMLGDLADSADLKRRFAQEARIGGEIESAHVVEVVGAGVDAATGAPWLAMELLQGEELSAYLQKSGPLAPSVVLELFDQLAHALGAAHDKQIVHRDLKPENLFLERSRRAGGAFTLKVLDFGIAKLMNQVRTSATGAMGTPLWMAPEQAQMGIHVTPAADVWAMGLIAFRVLAGKSFWKSAADPNSSTMMVLREVLMDPLPSASERARELNVGPGPEGFDGWFARCVERDPKRRFPHARQAFEELSVLLKRDIHRRGDEPSSAGTIAAQPLPNPTVAAAPLTLVRSPSAVVIPRAPSSISPVQDKWGLYVGAGAGAAGLIGLAVILSSASDPGQKTRPPEQSEHDATPRQTTTATTQATTTGHRARPETSITLSAALRAGNPKTFAHENGTITLTEDFRDLHHDDFERSEDDFSVFVRLDRSKPKVSSLVGEKRAISGVENATMLPYDVDATGYYTFAYATGNDTFVIVQPRSGSRCEARFRDLTGKQLATSIRFDIVEQLRAWCLSTIPK